MAAHPSSSVQQARQTIAVRLREILRDAGLTSRALARQAGWDESKCSRIIHGRTPPSDDDIRTWCRLCGAEEEIPNLIAASRNAESAYLEWRRVQRSQKRMQELRLTLYRETKLFRMYCTNVIPWPLQTSDYMRAIMTRFDSFHGGQVTDIDAAIAAREERKRYLRQPQRRCVMLIEEAVLLGRFAPVEVQKAQLSHVLTQMNQPNLSLGIIPTQVVCLHWQVETFSMFDDAQVFVELVSAGVTVTQPHEISLYARCFDDLARAAVYGEAARLLVLGAIAALDRK